mgnify:CR=1 FL=1
MIVITDNWGDTARVYELLHAVTAQVKLDTITVKLRTEATSSVDTEVLLLVPHIKFLPTHVTNKFLHLDAPYMYKI